MELNRALECAKNAAKEAGKKILEIYQNPFEVYIKADESPVTVADLEANACIVKCLREEYPSCSILSEEGADDLERLERSYVWLIDPLDGTKEFIKKNDQFSVNISLVHKGQVAMGVIYAPVTEEIYYAIRGRGSFWESKGKVQRLFVSDRIEERRMIIGQSTSIQCVTALARAYQMPVIRMGSALKGCMIAKGDAEVHYRFGPTMEWDTASMHLILEEAGGILRQLDDTPLTYNRRDPKNKKGFYMLNRQENKIPLE